MWMYLNGIILGWKETAWDGHLHFFLKMIKYKTRKQNITHSFPKLGMVGISITVWDRPADILVKIETTSSGNDLKMSTHNKI